MTKGYWIAHVTVTDAEKYPDYVTGARTAFEKYGATFLARGGKWTDCEGGMGRERHVLIEFPTYQAALDCYNSAEYQAAREHRLGAGEATVIVTEGFAAA
ncbi:DUF1330 domain-containing protein [Rhodobacteraceae bacterium NNCM2]|nr:DUF1330 domain-containing protein [Coraliihabitans acroporae]